MEAATARDGGFRFEEVLEGPCEVYVEAEGYAPTCAYVGSGESALEVTLHRAAAVEGAVVDTRGRPVVANVMRLSDPRMLPLGEYQLADVDEEGRFRCEGRAPGLLRLRAVVEGDGREGEIAVDVQEGVDVHGLRLVVAPPWRSSLRVRVLAGGRTLRDVSIRGDADRRVEWRDDVASLRFTEAAGTPVRLRVYENRRDWTAGRSAECVLATGEWDDPEIVDVALPELVPLRLETNAPPDARVRADFNLDTFSEAAARDGVWFLSPACRYTVEVRARGFLPMRLDGWRPPAGGGTLHVRLEPAAAVRGVVVDASGAPVPDVEAGAPGAASARTDAAGRFTLEGLSEGEHVLQVRRAYRTIGAARILAVRGATTDVGRIVARPWRTLRGRVVDEARAPVGGVSVAFRVVLPGETRLNDPYDGNATYSHADGSFAIEAPAMEGFLLARKRGYGATPAVPAPDVEIVLPRPALVRVDVVGDARRRGFGWICAVRWPDRVPGAVWQFGDWLPDTVEVAPGRVEILALGEELRWDGRPGETGIRARTIDAVQGVTAEVTFDR